MLHVCDLSLNVLVNKLETSVKSVIKWFEYNYIKLNESKCRSYNNSISWDVNIIEFQQKGEYQD